MRKPESSVLAGSELAGCDFLAGSDLAGLE